MSRGAVQDVLARIETAGIVPIVVIEDPSKAVQLGRTLLDAGLELVEITMRTKRAMEAIRLVSKSFPEMIIGAGTVFSVPVAKEALSAGAQFIVSPHLDEEIVRYCARRNIVSVPGVFTPSEIQRAIKAATISRRVKSVRDLPLIIKIFPASTGGPGHISAMRAVFPEVRFLPLGGVNASNLAEYIKAGSWAVGGTWLCKKDLIDTNNFARISELAREALRIIAEARR
ncbi:MAG: bifunctional 4-hydroxy-2-oxoglutarate aldolase/2-dehydro-3-deoxy-phosphogluconate aldolase [Candidatus Bathyarchaeia archaeon]|jgi:2-dehydro-3-deoxyphosphogluconate aldolase/(4S)-4-hydroxy-2-oxoglutarate aldolase